MNGSTARLEAVRWIIENCGIEQIIETGTFRGTTTEWFAQFDLPVLTAEINPRFATFSERRLSRHKNVTVCRGSSVELLKSWLSRDDVARRRTLFYLDAHWLESLPLREELDLIVDGCPSWIVVIDDFKVPGDLGYRYDDYGPGKVLDLEFVSKSKAGGAAAFLPTVASRWETGSNKRGFVVLVGNDELSRVISKQALLRRSL
ncbi:MAG: hypothetical protein ACT4OU_10025 [Hyphomicrobium sp.]